MVGLLLVGRCFLHSTIDFMMNSGCGQHWVRADMDTHYGPDIVRTTTRMHQARHLTQLRNSGVFLLILILHAAITSLATPIVAKLQTLYVVLNILYAPSFSLCHPMSTYDTNTQAMSRNHHCSSCGYSTAVQKQRFLCLHWLRQL